jgi:hypothetical protein
VSQTDAPGHLRTYAELVGSWVIHSNEIPLMARPFGRGSDEPLPKANGLCGPISVGRMEWPSLSALRLGLKATKVSQQL